MKPVLVLLFSALMCAGAAAQSIRIELQDIGERPAELSTAEKPYASLLTETLTRNISTFTNADSCPSVSARSIVFTDVSALDQMTQQIARAGGKVYNERMFVEICGAQYIPNYYIVVRPGQPHVIVDGVPGQTRASPQLQRDVQTQLMPAVRALASCPEPTAIGIAHTTSQDTPLGSAWEETWIVSACNKVVTVPIGFEPAPQGGINYAIRINSARVAA